MDSRYRAGAWRKMQSVGYSVRPLATHWMDIQRIHVLSIMCPGAEDRLKGPRGKEASGCWDVGFGCHSVKGNVPSLVVQEDAHMPGGLPHPGGGKSGRLALILLHHHFYPITILWWESHILLAARGCLADTQDPPCLVSHLHFSVMAAREQTQRAQGNDSAIESFWTSR